MNHLIKRHKYMKKIALIVTKNKQLRVYKMNNDIRSYSRYLKNFENEYFVH